MSVRIYSTLTGREDELVPLHPDGVLRMYVCGITPKFHPHVGHARTFVAFDVIRRYLVFRGYRLKYVQNFTDVDDKIIARAASQGRSPEAAAKEYMESFLEVMDRLNIDRADEYPTVTQYMERIVEFIAGLVESGHGYQSETGDVWFDVSSFPDYGKLSRRDLNSQLVAARKELEPGKRDPRDFALWKRAKQGEPSWPSPWGRGRPGWHIECSAMVRETLGDQIDVHGGGADLIFPHHENEIAQSESLTGKVPFARNWAHSGLVVLSGGDKMAQSADNFTTLASILDQYDPLEVRYWLLATHYRSSLTFAIEEDVAADGSTRAVVRGIEDARNALGRLRRALGPEPWDLAGPLDEPSVEAFKAAMDADFNTSDALAVIFELARDINRCRDSGASQTELDRRRRTLLSLLDVLGLDILSAAPDDGRSVEPYVELVRDVDKKLRDINQPVIANRSLFAAGLPDRLAGPARADSTEQRDKGSIESYIEVLLDTRRELRDIKQWALADEIRHRLAALGVIIEDKPGGKSTWRIER